MAQQQVKNSKILEKLNFELPPPLVEAVPKPKIYTVDVA
jgi:hypothetical protein